MPRFSVLGRLGLPVAAVAVALALWSTTTWALASPQTSSTIPPASSSHAVVAAPAENVSVGIPSAVLGPRDDLPLHLAAGTHRATVAVWLAAGSPSSVASVAASGGTIRGCSHVPLRAAAVTTLHCEVTTHGSALTLLARTTVAGHLFQKAYRHN